MLLFRGGGLDQNRRTDEAPPLHLPRPRQLQPRAIGFEQRGRIAQSPDWLANLSLRPNAPSILPSLQRTNDRHG